MYIWPEIDTGGLLDYYLETLTSDSCNIETISSYVKRCLAGEFSGKSGPDKASAHFSALADAVLTACRALERADGNKELESTLIDCRILAYLAKFHAFLNPGDQALDVLL